MAVTNFGDLDKNLKKIWYKKLAKKLIMPRMTNILGDEVIPVFNDKDFGTVAVDLRHTD